MEIGVPAGSHDADMLEASVQRSEASPVRAPIDALVSMSLDAILVEGDTGVYTAIRLGCAVPLIPIDASAGLEPIARDEIVDSLDAFADGRESAVRRCGLSVGIGGDERERALFEAMVMTTDAAAISEYDLRWHGDSIARYRADGIVVATPTGSGGYARAAGGPTIDPGVTALSVVPISPYRTTKHHWVLGDDRVEIRVIRDDNEVTLFADDESVTTVSPGDRVTLDPLELCTTLRFPRSGSPFAAGN